MAERIAKINHACLQLVEDNTRAGVCSVFPAVLHRLCQGMNVAQFDQLGVGPPWVVPCLRYLWNVQVRLEIDQSSVHTLWCLRADEART